MFIVAEYAALRIMNCNKRYYFRGLLSWRSEILEELRGVTAIEIVKMCVTVSPRGMQCPGLGDKNQLGAWLDSDN